MKKIMVLMMFICSLFLYAAGKQEEKVQIASSGSINGFTPAKDINFIVGFDAGGAADIPARIVTKYMTKYAGVNVTVANIVGSGGRIAAKQVKNTKPDGYTLLHVPVGYYLQAALGNADFTYMDFEPITMWCDSWVGLAVRKDSYSSYKEFIASAKANPGKIRVGAVAGTLPQLAVLAIMHKEGVQFNLVDIGLNNKATELLGGRIDAYIDAVGVLQQYVKANQFNCLMTFAYEKTKVPGYENVPTAESLGYSNFDYLLQSFGLWAPKGTSKEVIDYYVDLIRKCSVDKDCIAELNKLGYGARYEEASDYTIICEKVLSQTKIAVTEILKK
ncbi:tripartite tricarboxylate transporter substrate binding protein [Treponema sp. HNW]|uniref:tripartite tricarboxylate transporter substrate binding protein n=1 Tax=Treponema sp. HNW TaxID=3116654 RepID=UPI003D09E165